MTIPEPFGEDLREFLSAHDEGDVDVDDIFAKDFDRLMTEFARDAPSDIEIRHDAPRVRSMIDPTLAYVEVDAGILLCDGDKAIGGYLSCDLSLDAEYQGRGLGMEIVIERCLREGMNPVLHLDDAAYSPAGLAAHEAAWRHARGHPEETMMRFERLEEVEKR